MTTLSETQVPLSLGYLFHSRIISPETAAVTLKNLIPTNIFTVTENKSGDYDLGNGSVNFQINNSETTPETEKVP